MATPVASRGRGIQRERKPREVRRPLLIVAEGELTERQYFEGLAQHFRNTGLIVSRTMVKGLGKDPLRVVKEAIRQRDDPNVDYADVWAVVDVDEHALLDRAIQLADKSGIPLVVSNPCFELWLVWHYMDCSAHQTRDQLRRKLKNNGHSGKAIPETFPHESVIDAARRSMATHPGAFIRGENPSTTMADLISLIRRD